MADVNGTDGNDVLYGTSSDDVVAAGNGYDTIYGSAGRDTIDGGLLGDTLFFSFYPSRPNDSPGLSLTTGDRTITIAASQVTDSAGQIATSFTSVESISFGTSSGGFASGTTTIDASGFNPTSPGNSTERFTVSAFDVGLYTSQILRVTGTAQDDGMFVGLGNHVLDGGTGRDRLGIFGAGNMTLFEDAGVITAIGNGRTTIARNFEQVRLGTTSGGLINAFDLKIDIAFDAAIAGTYIGGSGNDLFENNYSNTSTAYPGIFIGGAGVDTYRYSSFAGNLDQDHILDFSAEDRIDLGFWTKNTSFIGNAAFTGVALQVRYEIVDNTTQLQVDNDGNGVADATLFIDNGAFRLVETFTGSDVLRLAGPNEATADNDTLIGTVGSDFINSRAGNDIVQGLGGNDQLNGDEGDDALYGGADADYLLGGNGRDMLDGGEGADTLYGQAGDDAIYGGAGNDLMRGGSGVDSFDGGDGFDRISFFNTSSDAVPTQGVVADLRRQLILNDGYGNVEQLVSVEALGGTLAFADILRGDDGNNGLIGGQGDKLYGFGGDDQIQADSIEGSIIDGGDGRDSLTILSGRDVITSTGGFGYEEATTGIIVDLSRSKVINDGYGASANIRSIEDFYAYSDFNSVLTGSGEANLLSAGTADDRLSGLGGDDRLVGNTGKDTLTGGAGADTFAFAGFQFTGYRFDPAGPSVATFAAPDSAAARRDADRIVDFDQSQGDKIDLSGIDAISFLDASSIGDNAFTWLGTRRFSGAAGEARYQVIDGDTYVYLEVNGQTGVDMMIRLDGVHTLTAGDFIL